MSDDDRSETGETEEIETYWHHVPTYMVDGPIAAAWIGGLHRIVLGEFVFNPKPEASKPAIRPVANIVLSSFGVRNLITYLQGLPGVSENAE